MTVLEALAQNKEAMINWSGMSEDFARKTIGHISNTLGGGVVGILDKGFLLIYRVTRQSVLFPICKTASAIIMDKEAESIYYSGIKYMEVAAPSEQELNELKKLSDNE